MFASSVAAVHSQITSLWSTGGKVVRYALYFGLCLGTIVGMLIAQPFISGVRGYYPTALVNDTPATTDAATTAGVNVSTTASYFQVVISPSRDLSTIEYAYVIVFSLSIIVAAAYVCFHFIAHISGALYKLEKPLAGHSCVDVISPRAWAHGDAKVGVLVAVILVCFTLLQSLLNLGTNMYLQSFAVDSELGFDELMLFRLSVLVAVGGALGNLAGMISARFVSIRYILIVVAAGQALMALLCLIIGSKQMTSLLVLAPLLYFFREAVLPTIIAWSGHYMLVYGLIVGLTELVSGLVIILYVPLQEYLYTSVAVESIFGTTLGFACVLFVCTWLMHWFTTNNDSYSTRLRKFYVSNREALPMLVVSADGNEKPSVPAFYVECKEINGLKTLNA